MTLEQLVTAWKNDTRIPVPFFGGTEVGMFFEDEEELVEFAPALLAFLSLTTADRDAASHHAYSYFRDFADEVGFGEGWIEKGMEDLRSPDARIWDFVYPNEITVSRSWELGDRTGERTYVQLEANCGWEEEHGLQMCWRDGTELVKLSPYDGHATNGHAYGDPAMDAFVYYGHSPRWRTRNLTFAD